LQRAREVPLVITQLGLAEPELGDGRVIAQRALEACACELGAPGHELRARETERGVRHPQLGLRELREQRARIREATRLDVERCEPPGRLGAHEREALRALVDALRLIAPAGVLGEPAEAEPGPRALRVERERLLEAAPRVVEAMLLDLGASDEDERVGLVR